VPLMLAVRFFGRGHIHVVLRAYDRVANPMMTIPNIRTRLYILSSSTVIVETENAGATDYCPASFAAGTRVGHVPGISSLNMAFNSFYRAKSVQLRHRIVSDVACVLVCARNHGPIIMFPA
jgi:hypothetical protein